MTTVCSRSVEGSGLRCYRRCLVSVLREKVCGTNTFEYPSNFVPITLLTRPGCRHAGLLIGRAAVQELQCPQEPLCPCLFVMRCSRLPDDQYPWDSEPLTLKRISKPMDILYWFTDRTDADKHLVRPSSESVSFVEKIIIMSVQRRAFEQQFPKSSWILHDSVERDASPVRRATKPSLRWVGVSAILTINERHHLIQQERRVLLCREPLELGA